MKRWSIGVAIIWLVAGCAAPLRTTVAPFPSPDLLPSAERLWHLVIAVDLLDTPEKSARVFGTDLAAADILPVQVVVKNTGNQEYEINAAQIYGSAGREYFPAFNLHQAAQRVRESSIGTTVATQAVLGALAGAAAGASEHYTHRFRHELAVQDFGDRVVSPGDLLQGFIYFQVQPYRAIRIKVTNITEGVIQEIELPVTVTPRNRR
jgi:hypothetical protein